jgi:glucose-1-phosphate cytidylyltransferase
MKVVLFCGGLGMRLRDFNEEIPKPMIKIGYRPILWHVMKYYANFGHNEFILCLGHKSDIIKNYFLNYDECLSNDFILDQGSKQLQLLNSDIQNWKITFVDTGLHASIGQRLMAVRKYLDGEEVFLANYSDGLTDLFLPDMLEKFCCRENIASFLCVKPTQSFHVVSLDDDGCVYDIRHVAHSDMWINGGYFIFRKEIFDYIQPGEDLVMEPFTRLIQKKELYAHQYRKFWACMDTFKDKQMLEDMYTQGNAPWQVWKVSDSYDGKLGQQRK